MPSPSPSPSSKKTKPSHPPPSSLPPPSSSTSAADQSDEDEDASFRWQTRAAINRLSVDAQRAYYEALFQSLFALSLPDDFHDFFGFLLTNHIARDGCSRCTETSLHLPCAESVLTVLPPTSTLAGISCCGPYDWVAGLFDAVERRRVKPWLHWRYFFDLPQLMTVYRAVADAKVDDADSAEGGWHCGYWRDAPTDAPSFLVASPNASPAYTVQGLTMYHAMHRHLLHLRNVSSKGPHASASHTALIDSTIGRLVAHGSAHDCEVLSASGHPTAPLRDAGYLARKRRVLAPTLNSLGFVCPYEPSTEVGFRPLPLTTKALQAMLQRMQREDDDGRAVNYAEWDGVQTLLTLAMDECDPGTVELFCMECFCTGAPAGISVVEGEISQGMRRAWEMMGGREGWRKCIAQSLKYRRRSHLSQLEVARKA